MESIAQGTSRQRAELLARLAAERSYLLLQLEGLDEPTLTNKSVIDDWTITGLLAHLAYWEALSADRLGNLAAGRASEIRSIGGDDAVDKLNADIHDRFSRLGFDEALAMLQKERRNFLMALGQTSDESLKQRVPFPDGRRVMARQWATQPHRHDAEHAVELARHRPPADPSIRVIHRSLLRPIMGLSQREFLALAALVPVEARETRPLDGEWMLKQIIGHLADYEGLGIVALKAVAADREPVYAINIDDFDSYNNDRATIWAATTWTEVWATYLATRRALLLVAETLADDALARPFTAPWRETTTACGYLLDMAQHEREHADALRRAFAMRPLPRRLGR